MRCRLRLLGRPTRLPERLEDHPEVVPVIVETRRRDRQHLGDPRAGAPHHIQNKAVHGVGLGLQQRQHLALEQVRGHGVEGLREQRPLVERLKTRVAVLKSPKPSRVLVAQARFLCY